MGSPFYHNNNNKSEDGAIPEPGAVRTSRVIVVVKRGCYTASRQTAECFFNFDKVAPRSASFTIPGLMKR
ncbi:Hypothetical predicted protein [Xyrichtys novacula]|uniref:Uncharacterized protein n=1 Tax=Xyrichtys novacula TaxID=13765 RepID=A0AAV1EYX5_XYRNO|nr:Hypothetical predicted protein [Xyrichtys novacula]